MPNYLQSAQSELVVDISTNGGIREGSALQALVRKAEANQYWTTEDVPGQPGYFWIVSADQGLVIDISNNNGGVKSGSQLQVLQKKAEANQYWTWLPTQFAFAVPDTGFGSGPNNANFSASLTLRSDGTVYFAGQYQDTGNLPIVDAPSQSYNVVAGVLASNKKLYTFGHGNSSVPTGGKVDAWGPQSFINTINPAPSSATVVPDNVVYPAIIAAWDTIGPLPQCTFKASNSSDLASIIGELVSWAESAISDTVEVVGVIASVA
jgi:hypothetical protein